jgi:hypothetical protein
LEVFRIRAVFIENCFLLIYVENGWVEPATFRSITVDRASLTVVKDTSPHQILELPFPNSLDYEEILEAKAFYPCYI